MPARALLSLIVVFVVIQGAFWLLLLFWLRRRLGRLRRELWAAVLASGEVIIMEPQSALYRGAKFGYGTVRGNGLICVTDKRIIFQKLLGQRIEIPRSEIVSVTEGWRFKGMALRKSRTGQHVIMRTRDNNEIGFLLRNSQGLKKLVTPK